MTVFSHLMGIVHHVAWLVLSLFQKPLTQKDLRPAILQRAALLYAPCPFLFGLSFHACLILKFNYESWEYCNTPPVKTSIKILQ